MQGTGTIIASQGKYYLATALHCMRKEEEGTEVVSPDWHKLSATVYLKDREVELNVIGFLDADYNEDWAIVEIEKPNVDFDYPARTTLTDTFSRDDVFGSYGFPKDIDDGIELEFVPTNSRGTFWRLKDITDGGTVKAITLEKGCSGMGLYRMEGDKYCCLGLINKSAPSGAFNAMRLIRAKSFAPKYFPDVYVGCGNPIVGQNQSAPDYSPEQVAHEMQPTQVQLSDQELFNKFVEFMELSNYAEATQVIKELYDRIPQNESVAVNYFNALSLSDPSKLNFLTDSALSISYSSPMSAIVSSRAFTRSGFPEIGVEIWYNSALRFNDPEFDCMFYVECLGADFGKVVYKEYEVVEHGKSVLYAYNDDTRHNVIADDKSLMGKSLMGHKVNESIDINIAGEIKTITIIAIHDKYYGIVHRALKDVMEHGGNSIMTPIKLGEESTAEDLIKLLESLGGESPDDWRKRIYKETPSLLMVSHDDDIIGSYYRLMFSDFKRYKRPDIIDNSKYYETLNTNFSVVLDLSSLLALFEMTCSGVVMPKQRFLLPRFVYELIKDYRRNFMTITSFDMYKTLKVGRIHHFDDDPMKDMEQRLDTMIRWCDDHCVMDSSVFMLQNTEANLDNRTKMLNAVMCLVVDEPNRILLSEDWYIQIMMEGFPVCSIEDFFETIAFTIFQ